MQLSALTRLQDLSLEDSEYEGDGFPVLASLSSLRRLRMVHPLRVPACLSMLTFLLPRCRGLSDHMQYNHLASQRPACLTACFITNSQILPGWNSQILPGCCKD